MKLNGKNIKVKRGAATLIVTLAISMGAVSCSSEKIPKIDETLNKTTILTQDNSMLDDVLKVSKTDNGSLTELDKLDRAIEIYEKLKDSNLDNYSYILTEEEKDNLDNLPVSYVETMQEVLEDEDTAKEERTNTGKWLNYLQDDAKSTIENAAPIIIEAGLKRAIKAGAVDALELSPEEFSSVTISPERLDEGKYILTVAAQDKNYSVEENSIYGRMIKHLYDIQRKENRNFNLNLKQSKTALNLIKVSAYSGAKLSDNNEITSEVSYSDIRALQKSRK